MNDTDTSLHIWIYNDPSVASLLRSESPLWPQGKPSFLAEFADAPTLSLPLDLETPVRYPGAPGLLGAGTSASELCVRLPGSGIPAILAPAFPQSPSVWAATLRFLAQSQNLGEHPRILLLDAALFETVAHALSCASSVNWIWDLAMPPSSRVQALATCLSSEDLAGPAKWKRFVAYFGNGHQPNDNEIKKAQESLSTLPGAELFLEATPLVQ